MSITDEDVSEGENMPSRPFHLALISCVLLGAPASLAEGSPASAQLAPGQAARDLAYEYLSLWSAPNQRALASAPSFYGRTVTFHGRTRTLSSVLAEKRRFAERWPDRSYRYRPETTRVACEFGRSRCTVWSIFDFSAAHPREGRRSVGVGEHELVITFSGGRSMIAAENSRVLHRGRPSS
jgi:hypothetical protein